MTLLYECISIVEGVTILINSSNKIFMNNKIRNYIQNQLNRAPLSLKEYVQNEEGEKYLKRNIYIKIKKYINNFLEKKTDIRMVAIPGLRGVGKTTILAQAFLELFPDYQKNLLYISADEITNLLNSDLNTVIKEYQEILGTSFEKLDKKVFLFIDEIHYDKNWATILKSIYDKSKKVFVICTGSSALSLSATPDLTRRLVFETLYPMNFTEYMLLKTKHQSLSKEYINPKFPVKGLKKKIKNALFNSQNAKKAFSKLKKYQKEVNQYWADIDKLEIKNFLQFGTMPFALNIPNKTKLINLTNELIDKVIKTDLPQLNKFDTSTLEKTKNILLMIAASDVLNVTNISQDLDKLSKDTLRNLLKTLENAEMLIRVYPFGANYKKIRKPSRYYFMSPSLRYSLLNIIEGDNAFNNKFKGKYLEDIAALTFYREFYHQLTSPIYYDSIEGGADFILRIKNKKIIIEIGLNNKTIKQAQNSLDNRNGDYGIVISKSNLDVNENIIQVPLEYFLLI